MRSWRPGCAPTSPSTARRPRRRDVGIQHDSLLCNAAGGFVTAPDCARTRHAYGRGMNTTHALLDRPGHARDCQVDDHALATRWRESQDHWARDELINRYMPMARRLAARYNNPHESREDLVQVASIGLVAAVDRFDPRRRLPVASCAIPTSLGEIKRHCRNTGWSVHVPRGAQELAQRVDGASRELMAR